MRKKKYTKQVSLGFDGDGKRIRHYFHYDSVQELGRLIEEYKANMGDKPKTELFGDYADRWVKTFKTSGSPRTTEMYRNAINKCDMIRDFALTRITSTDCQEIINDNKEHPRLCEQIEQTLRQIFNQALEDGLVDRNPCHNLSVPKYKAAERRALTDDELKAVEKVKLAPKAKLYFELIRVYGLRPCEVIALYFEDFDEATNMLTINKAITFDGNDPVLKSTKTMDERHLPIVDRIWEAYYEVREGQNKTGLIFRGKDNGMLTRDGLKWLKKCSVGKIKAETGIEDLISYSFRHNRITEVYYSAFVSGELSAKQIAKLFGNSEEMILKIYSHLREEEKEKVKGIYDRV